MDLLQSPNISSCDNQSMLNSTNVFNRSVTVPEPPRYLIVTASLFYVVIFILGVLGNLVVIVVILANKNMKSTVNMFLINLCVADLLVMIICMPPTLVELHVKEVWYFGEFMCKAVPFLEFMVSSASIFTILTISIERYRVVCRPLSVNEETLQQFVRIILVIWAIAILTSIPILPIIVFKDSRLKDGTPIKVCRIPARDDWHKIYFILNAIITYFIPFLILTILYIRLCRKLISRQYDNTSIEFHEHTQNEKLRLRWQVVNILTTIVCVFFLCHLPYRVVSIWMMLEKKSKLISMGLEAYLNIIYSARLLLYLNHALNPILYNFVSTKFRMALRLLVSDKRRQGSAIFYNRKKTQNNEKQRSTKNSTDIRLAVAAEKIDKDSRNSNDRGKLNDFSSLYVKYCKLNDENPDTKDRHDEIEIGNHQSQCLQDDQYAESLPRLCPCIFTDARWGKLPT